MSYRPLAHAGFLSAGALEAALRGRYLLILEVSSTGVSLRDIASRKNYFRWRPSQYQKGEPYAVVFPPQAATLLQRITHDADPIQSETRGQRRGSVEVGQHPPNAGSLLTQLRLPAPRRAGAAASGHTTAPPPASAPPPRGDGPRRRRSRRAPPRTAKSKKRPNAAPPRRNKNLALY